MRDDQSEAVRAFLDRYAAAPWPRMVSGYAADTLIEVAATAHGYFEALAAYMAVNPEDEEAQEDASLNVDAAFDEMGEALEAWTLVVASDAP